MADSEPDDESNRRGLLCAHYDATTTPACGKAGAKLCSLIYIILNILSCSLLVNLIGFSTAYWSFGEGFYHNGLWLSCGLNTQKRCQYLPYDAVGYGTPYWTVYKWFNAGLWNKCYKFHCLNLCSDDGWFQATQAVETIGLFAAFLALVFLVLFIFHAQSSTNKAIFVIAMLSTFCAAGLTILGVVIYGAKNRDLSWSYGLSVIAGILYTGSGILMAVHLNLNL